MPDSIIELTVVALRVSRDYHVGTRRRIPNAHGRSISHNLPNAEFVIRHCPHHLWWGYTIFVPPVSPQSCGLAGFCLETLRILLSRYFASPKHRRAGAGYASISVLLRGFSRSHCPSRRLLPNDVARQRIAKRTLTRGEAKDRIDQAAAVLLLLAALA
jgi:hypothetical protein